MSTLTALARAQARLGIIPSEAAEEIDASALADYADLAPFDVIVLAPERTLAEKLAFLQEHITGMATVQLFRREARAVSKLGSSVRRRCFAPSSNGVSVASAGSATTWRTAPGRP